ncbi:hypothetical protein EH183_43330 [Streptomyces sp. CB01881]|nr:hypothetical protein EH183_43330 [Streptomyces sp. CB01881]
MEHLPTLEDVVVRHVVVVDGRRLSFGAVGVLAELVQCHCRAVAVAGEPADCADHLVRFLEQATPEERRRGPGLARRAVAEFTGPVAGEEERHELVVTHNFLVGWLVREALDAPKWRWLGLNHANTGLTVIRYAPGRPSSVVVFNDTRHLPGELPL